MAFVILLALLGAGPAPVKVPELEAVLRKGGKPAEALALLKEIGAMSGNHAEAKALVKLVRNTRIRKPPEVLEACFVALKGIGSRQVTRGLVGLLRVHSLKKDKRVRIGICRALAGSADPSAVETVLDLLRDPEDEVVAAAAGTAGAYRFAKASIRKDLFRTIVDIYAGTWNLKNAVQPDLKTEKRRAERKWELVAAPMERSLQLLSNVTMNSPPEWRRWWNKNKRKRWEELED